MSSSADSAALRGQLDHPVLDSDGHVLEFLPAVRDHLVELAGAELAARFDLTFNAGALTRGLPAAQKRALGLFRMTWWGFPARNSLDRATAMLPRLLYERLDEIGLDFAVVYPTLGLSPLSLDDPELRTASARAFNRYHAEAFAGTRDRLEPVAVIPMHTPEEAIAELDHAVLTLGFKAAVLAGHVFRPLEGEALPRAARWLDTLGLDSLHDYDPVWARCLALGIAPTFHSSAMGWGSRASLTSYVYNHLGNFAVAGETTCRSLLLGGVPMRFPELRFAFLEGGVGWGANLFSDVVGHFEKRNRTNIQHYNPAHLDRARLAELFARYGDARFARLAGQLDTALNVLSDPEEDPAGIDEFAASRIERAEDIRDIFAERFYFGCEADDRVNAAAFDTRVNPFGARLRAIFSSDIGHWDVPDMRGVLAEAWQLVDEGLVSREDFRDFVFANPVSLFAGVNPAFFDGTVVESAVNRLRSR